MPKNLSIQHDRLIYPDILEEGTAVVNTDNNSDDENESGLISHIFFELANSTEIWYRVRNQRGIRKEQQYLVFEQDVNACSRHTGGIIWETSYLLLEYLTEKHLQSTTTNQFCLGRTLELGAGVGFLGQCMVAEYLPCTPRMTLTETSEVLINLQRNMVRNQPLLKENDKCSISVCKLDWTSYENNIQDSGGKIQPHSIDTILGTDVIFTKTLVEPLLQTAQFVSHNNTVWYLCVQIRCAEAHEYFLQQAIQYGFYIHDISNESFSMSSKCWWGKQLDCYLFRITRTPRRTQDNIETIAEI